VGAPPRTILAQGEERSRLPSLPSPFPPSSSLRWGLAAPPLHRPGPAAARRRGAASTGRHPSNRGGESIPRATLALFPSYPIAAEAPGPPAGAAAAPHAPPLFPGREEEEKGKYAQNPLPSLLFV